jgi:hypothetical protein
MFFDHNLMSYTQSCRCAVHAVNIHLPKSCMHTCTGAAGGLLHRCVSRYCCRPTSLDAQILHCTTLPRLNVVLLHRRPNTLDMAFKGANQRETRGGGLVRWVALPIRPLNMTSFEMIAGAAPIGYLIAGDVANGKSSM